MTNTFLLNISYLCIRLILCLWRGLDLGLFSRRWCRPICCACLLKLFVMICLGRLALLLLLLLMLLLLKLLLLVLLLMVLLLLLLVVLQLKLLMQLLLELLLHEPMLDCGLGGRRQGWQCRRLLRVHKGGPLDEIGDLRAELVLIGGDHENLASRRMGGELGQQACCGKIVERHFDEGEAQ